MFKLQVIQDEQIIQSREYSTAHECTQKMMLAHDYYQYRGQAVTIQMLDTRGLLIKSLQSDKELDQQIT